MVKVSATHTAEVGQKSGQLMLMPDDEEKQEDWVHVSPTSCCADYFHPDNNGTVYDSFVERMRDDIREEVIEEEVEDIQQTVLNNLVDQVHGKVCHSCEFVVQQLAEVEVDDEIGRLRDAVESPNT